MTLDELPGVEQRKCPTCPPDECWWPADEEFFAVYQVQARIERTVYKTRSGEIRSYESHRAPHLRFARQCRACAADQRRALRVQSRRRDGEVPRVGRPARGGHAGVAAGAG